MKTPQLYFSALLTLLVVSSCTRTMPQNGTVRLGDSISNGYNSTPLHTRTGAGSSFESPKSVMLLENYLQALPGVNVSGSGSSATVTVRGVSSFQTASNEPLFIVSGVPMSSYASTYNTVNPNDIKRVTVLTDAGSTAIYGSRGAAGVILITLKNAN